MCFMILFTVVLQKHRGCCCSQGMLTIPHAKGNVQRCICPGAQSSMCPGRLWWEQAHVLQRLPSQEAIGTHAPSQVQRPFCLSHGHEKLSAPHPPHRTCHNFACLGHNLALVLFWKCLNGGIVLANVDGAFSVPVRLYWSAFMLAEILLDVSHNMLFFNMVYIVSCGFFSP